jgi:glycerol-3-phosphate dehydrogenase
LPRARPLEGGIADQTLRAVRDEMAMHLADVVLRRTDLGTAGPPAPPDLEAAARAMATTLGWDERKASTERQEVSASQSP